MRMPVGPYLHRTIASCVGGSYSRIRPDYNDHADGVIEVVANTWQQTRLRGD